MRYVRTWFGVDLVATFPWEVVLIAVPDIDPILIRAFKMPRVLRLIRLRKELQALETGTPPMAAGAHHGRRGACAKPARGAQASGCTSTGCSRCFSSL